MKKRRLIALLGIILVISLTNVSAQNALEGVYTKEHVMNRRPVPYQYLREADVMWSKTVWRKIDLREKLNHPLYYPAVDGASQIDDRFSLIDLLLWAIDNQGLQAYNPTSEYDEFKTPITRAEINKRFGAEDKTTMVEDLETGQLVQKTVAGSVKSSEVKEFMLKELWFFDKQRSVLEVRIIGMCPIRWFYKDDDAEKLDPQQRKLFWIYFPQARKIFANHLVYNERNDADTKSFDDIFAKRLFSSFIIQESNVFNNRKVDEYSSGIETLLESERIKENIFNFEHDLWEY